MARPAYRLLAKPKDGGKAIRVGDIWANDFGGFNIKLTEEDAQYKTGDLRKLDLDDYWLNIVPVDDAPREDRKPRRQPRRRGPEPEESSPDEEDL